MRDFPRATRHLDPRRPALSYLSPHPVPVWTLGDYDSTTAAVGDVKVIERQRAGNATSISVDIADVQLQGRAADAVVRASSAIREALVNQVRENGSVVSPGFEPEYKIQVRIHVYGEIDA